MFQVLPVCFLGNKGDEKMEGPFCKKCGGELGHKTESNFWICKECGCVHTYVEKTLDDKQIGLRELNARLINCTDQATDGLQKFMEVMQQIQEFDCKPQGPYCVEDIVSKSQHSYKLFCDSARTAKELIEWLETYVTLYGDGSFELWSDKVI